MERSPLDAVALRERLGARWPWIEVVDETGSTNADLLEAAAQHPPAPDRSLLVAEYQTAGRGRLERPWSAPARSSLLFSVLLRPSVPRSRWGWLPLMMGVAVHAAVSAAGVGAVRLKWPNDVLVGPDERKMAGILAQAHPTVGDAVVVGTGLNVSTTAEEFGDVTGTSLAQHGPTVSRLDLLVDVLGRFDSLASDWTAAGGDAHASRLDSAYRGACSTIGRQVKVSGIDGSELVGHVQDIDASGHLLVAASDGLHTVAAGDVWHLRPTV